MELINMARRRSKKGRRSGSHKVPLTIAIPLLIHAVPTVKHVLKNEMDIAAFEGMAIGPGGKFDMNKATMIAVPYVAGILAHKMLGRQINRYIPKWSPVNF